MGHSYRRAFFHNFHVFFAHFLRLPDFRDFYSPKYVNFNKLDIFASSGEFREYGHNASVY